MGSMVILDKILYNFIGNLQEGYNGYKDNNI